MMTSPEDAEDEFQGHIPGSGVDFGVVRALRTLAPRSRIQHEVPRAIRNGIRIAGPERIVCVAGQFAQGDIAIELVDTDDGQALGRPLQVLYAEDGWAAVLDDASLGSSRSPDELLSMIITTHEFAPAAVWHVLDLWDIYRCPRCRAPGLTIDYGLATGPAMAGTRLGGCVITPLSGNVACSECDTQWDRAPCPPYAAA